MFDGYLDQPEATLEAFRGLWYHTGDAEKKLESGQLTFVDRKKDACGAAVRTFRASS